ALDAALAIGQFLSYARLHSKLLGVRGREEGGTPSQTTKTPRDFEFFHDPTGLDRGEYACLRPSTEWHDSWGVNPKGVFVKKCHYTDSTRTAVDINGPPARIASISDGLSNTLMVGERPPLWNELSNNGPWGCWPYSTLDSVLGIAHD